ncbi:MAG: heat-inducible transcriptional repressor HrcA [Prochloraceae cyanobacterium]|nr:heat-inducible transcriptional repressor HrcA [Prochloraceae cyanobacterium]
MPVKGNLNKRNRHILRVTIQHYIATAEPVGSKTLAREYDLSVSSATIRNAMGQLEKAGLLYQPHTSAGRIPSDWGYRTYVDLLITPDEKAAKKIEKSLTQELNQTKWSFEATLQRAAQILAAISGYIVLITMPQSRMTQLKHLQLVRVNPKQVMLIIVTDSYQTESVLLHSSDRDWLESSETELEILSNFLNSKLRGRSFSEISSLDWGELDREFKSYAEFLRNLLQELANRSLSSSTTPIMVRGISEALRQPEFSQLEQVQTLLHLLEAEQDLLLPLIFADPELNNSDRKVSIKIGSENPLESMHPCTLISSVYRQGDRSAGSVGIIGPTRMLYENAIALVESTADYLSEVLS